MSYFGYNRRIGAAYVAYNETAIRLLVGLNLKTIRLDVPCASDGRWKFLMIVTDGLGVNKLSVGILAHFRMVGTSAPIIY